MKIIYTVPLENAAIHKLEIVIKNGKLLELNYVDESAFPFDDKNYSDESDARQYKDKNEIMCKKAFNWLDKYFQGIYESIDNLEFDLKGSEFQRLVWNKIKEIPPGETWTYGELAEKIAKIKGVEKMSAQAIGGALGKNPLSIIIPCHRVVGKDGKLVGYGGGIARKTFLLAHERAML